MVKSISNVVITRLSDNRISVELEVTPGLCKACYEEAIARLGSSIKLPGFRAGKIPKQVIVQQIGISHIRALALEKLIDQAWKAAIEQESIEPISEAEVKESLQDLADRFNPNQKMIFTLEVEVKFPQTENTKQK